MAHREARLITLRTHNRSELLPLTQQETRAAGSSPEAASVEGLPALQPGGEVLKVIGKLLVFSKLHHIIEVLHVLDHRVELENIWRGRSVRPTENCRVCVLTKPVLRKLADRLWDGDAACWVS